MNTNTKDQTKDQNCKEAQEKDLFEQTGGFKQTGVFDQTGGFSIGGVFNWISRLMIASLFIITGIMMAMNFREFVATIQKYGLPQPLVLAVIGLSAKILGGLMFTGLLPIPYGVGIGRLVLLVFTAIATFFAHNPLKDSSQLQNMLKNIAIMGGLLAA